MEIRHKNVQLTNANLTSSRKVCIMDKQSNKMLFHLTLHSG